jgi:hypothetical protein
MEVPEMVLYELPVQVDNMEEPGAATSIWVPVLLEGLKTSLRFVFPTARTPCPNHAG